MELSSIASVPEEASKSVVPAAAAQNTPTSAQKASSADVDLYVSDEFRMYCYKILPCSKRFSHDWVSCPFAHPGEKARRRCVRSMPYSANACPDMQKAGECPRGDACNMTHSVFEYWLHPQRYRTQLCNDGRDCHRKICFFAHNLQELRVPALAVPVSAGSSIPGLNPTTTASSNASSMDVTLAAVDSGLAALLPSSSSSTNTSLTLSLSSSSSRVASITSEIMANSSSNAVGRSDYDLLYSRPAGYAAADSSPQVTTSSSVQHQQQVQSAAKLQAQLQQLVASAASDDMLADMLTELVQEINQNRKQSGLTHTSGQDAATGQRQAVYSAAPGGPVVPQPEIIGAVESAAAAAAAAAAASPVVYITPSPAVVVGAPTTSEILQSSSHSGQRVVCTVMPAASAPGMLPAPSALPAQYISISNLLTTPPGLYQDRPAFANEMITAGGQQLLPGAALQQQYPGINLGQPLVTTVQVPVQTNALLWNSPNSGLDIPTQVHCYNFA